MTEENTTQNSLFFVSDYFKTQVDEKDTNPCVKNAVKVYTPSPLYFQHKKISWTEWLFGTESVSEELEYLQYMNFLEYYYQLGNLGEDWEKEIFDEVMKDEDFVVYLKKKEELKNELLLKKFKEWKETKELVTTTSIWKLFHTKSFLNTHSYKKFVRTKTRDFFNEYVVQKKSKTIEKPKEPVIQKIEIKEVATNKIDDEIILKLKKMDRELDEGYVKNLIKEVTTSVPKFNWKDDCFKVVKSIHFYQNEPKHFSEIIEMYIQMDLLEKSSIESLRQCETFAKLGFDLHMKEIKKMLKEKECLKIAQTNKTKVGDELMSFFKSKTIEKI